MFKTIEDKIREEKENNIGNRILEELRKKPIENSLLIFDLVHEKSERVEVYPLDSQNFLILWKCFEPPDALIRAESEEKLAKLLEKVEDIGCSFLVPQELADFIEGKYNMKRIDLLLYATDEKNFNSFVNSKHSVKRLSPELKNFEQNVKQIVDEWDYSKRLDDPTSFMREKMTKFPFFGIGKGNELLAYGGTHAQTEDVSFLGFLYTKKDYRRHGLQSSVTSTLVQDAFDSNKVPAMYIVKDNIPSIGLAEKLGFRCKTTYVNYIPK